jgi:hypothetical protein
MKNRVPRTSIKRSSLHLLIEAVIKDHNARGLNAWQCVPYLLLTALDSKYDGVRPAHPYSDDVKSA